VADDLPSAPDSTEHGVVVDDDVVEEHLVEVMRTE
jgi:hypothetical protein